ncbi:hypothetical protein [Salinarchaeum laminariae]|uniref:hypothetical protein n=1 Tax=Salinarchaeum laminariae TaxID=869888 RepID=UPI0020C12D32|nr:hypothetical protein [Salinarchaeum laminariae]
MVRYETVVEDGVVYVATGEERLAVGDLETIVDLVGGRAWTVEYSDREKQAHPKLNTADEGLTVDVVDTINAMTFGEPFVETLAAQPSDAAGEEGVSPRLGLFVGRLLENLEYGLR